MCRFVLAREAHFGTGHQAQHPFSIVSLQPPPDGKHQHMVLALPGTNLPGARRRWRFARHSRLVEPQPHAVGAGNREPHDPVSCACRDTRHRRRHQLPSFVRAPTPSCKRPPVQVSPSAPHPHQPPVERRKSIEGTTVEHIFALFLITSWHRRNSVGHSPGGGLVTAIRKSLELWKSATPSPTFSTSPCDGKVLRSRGSPAGLRRMRDLYATPGRRV